MQADRRLLGWGVFFILLGAVPLATKAGLLDTAVVDRWPLLWPVLLIGWGLGLLLRGTRLALIGGAVSAITFGLMGGGALATGFGGIPFASGCSDYETIPAAFPARTGELGPTANVEIEFSCGSLTVGNVDGSGWSVTGSDRDGSGPTITARSDALAVKPAGGRTAIGSSGRATWDVFVPTSPVIALGITLNAGTLGARLEGNLSTVNLTVNAGSATVDLARAEQLGPVGLTINAGSAIVSLPRGSHAAHATVNAGSLEICLPAGSPLRVDWSGALASNDLDAAGLTKVDENTWASPGLDPQEPYLELGVTANAGSFSLNTTGTC